MSGATNLGNCRINVVNNYYLPGPDTPAGNLPLAAKTETEGALKVFSAGNLFVGQPQFTADNFMAIDFERWSKGNYRKTSLDQVRVEQEFEIAGARPATDAPAVAFERILREAGASRRRDAADRRLVQGVRDRTHRLIDSQDEVGGWPELKGEAAPRDTDRDGMPDAWEQGRGLDPQNPNDRNGDRDGDGYTNLEEYLNERCR